MLRAWRKLAIMLGTGMMFCFAAVPGHAAPAKVKVRNTSTYVGAGRWDWTIYVEADPDTLRQIKCVEYILHPTFPNPVRKVCDQPKTKFAYSTNGWGTFTVKVRIVYKDERVDTLEHRLIFRQSPVPTHLNVTPKNWAREIEPGWWEWGVYVDGAGTELDRIRCVEYTLHPTFPNRVRVVCDRASKFLLTARGWGTFRVGIKVMLKDDSVYELHHDLKFR